MPSGLLLVWASGAGGFKGSVYQQLEELQGIGELGGEATEDVHHVEVFLIESLCSSVGEYPEGTAHFCCVPGQKETVSYGELCCWNMVRLRKGTSARNGVSLR